MDLMRSCYKRPIRYVAGNPTITALATWYRTKPGAKVFPTWHSFTSQNWDYSHPTFFDIGEVPTLKPQWSNGRRLNTSDGTSFAGPLEYFQTGAPAPGFLPRGVNDTPTDCLRAPFGIALGGFGMPIVSAKGGKLLGGTATSSTPLPPPGTPCANCPVLYTPSYIPLIMAGFSAPWTGFNNAFNVTQISACTWSISFFIAGNFHVIGIVRTALNAYDVSLFYNAVNIAQYIGVTPDCQSTAVLPTLVPTPGQPLTVQVF